MPRDNLSSAQGAASNTPEEGVFEEFIGPGFVSRGHYEEVLWPAVDVCEACGRPLGTSVIETVAVEVTRGDRDERSDAGIGADLRDSLEWHPDIDASAVEVEVVRGEVTLRGLIRDRTTHRQLIELTLDTPGVIGVRDDLRLGRIRAA